jgi:hypothetical protein
VNTDNPGKDEMTCRMLISDCIKLYDNDDSLLRRYAHAAYDAGRAAYWTVVSYHSQKAASFANRANYLPQDHDGAYLLQAGIEAYGNASYGTRIEALDTLIPLNERAARDLAQAYADTGIWKDEDQLLARRLRREA